HRAELRDRLLFVAGANGQRVLSGSRGAHLLGEAALGARREDLDHAGAFVASEEEGEVEAGVVGVDGARVEAGGVWPGGPAAGGGGAADPGADPDGGGGGRSAPHQRDAGGGAAVQCRGPL